SQAKGSPSAGHSPLFLVDIHIQQKNLTLLRVRRGSALSAYPVVTHKSSLGSEGEAVAGPTEGIGTGGGPRGPSCPFLARADDDAAASFDLRPICTGHDREQLQLSL